MITSLTVHNPKVKITNDPFKVSLREKDISKKFPLLNSNKREENSTFAVGIPYLSHKFFMNFLEPSKAAASADGPNVGIPAFTRSFARPATRGASGPTTTNPTPQLRQKENTAALSEMSRSEIQVASPELEIPAFPGAQNTESHEGDRFKA